MANDTTITVQGRAGTNPRLMEGERGRWTTFRLATSRRVRMPDGRWRDGPTTWYSVHVNGALVERAVAGIDKGTPVLVRGRLEAREYEDSARVIRTELRIQAEVIGLDLMTKGSIVWRPPAPREEEAPGQAPAVVADVSAFAEIDDDDDARGPAESASGSAAGPGAGESQEQGDPAGEDEDAPEGEGEELVLVGAGSAEREPGF